MDSLRPIDCLTGPLLPIDQRRSYLREFARENGWHPSDEILEYRGTEQVASGHLLVEHGLDNTAVITFLSQGQPFTSLPYGTQKAIVSLSYNNLVDWHLFPDSRGVTCVFNRSSSFAGSYISLAELPSALRAESFDRLVGRRPNPNLPALDDALIDTVARWRRLLASDLPALDDTAPLAELFNTIFFVRALEDDRRTHQGLEPALLHDLRSVSPGQTIRATLRNALLALTNQLPPPELIDFESLSVFDSLDYDTQIQLVGDFYENRFAPYEYDFCLMSKHALSRIYERYISLLRPMPSQQKWLFGRAEDAKEVMRREKGEVYTPQYIARFFSRFLQENMTPPAFRALRAVDPACGSGIFLRTLLETQCDPLQNRDVESVVRQAFQNISGVDVEENACKASRLSLTLLHIALTGRFPEQTLNILSANALDHFAGNMTPEQMVDAVIANPPYVRWESIPTDWQEKVRAVLKDSASARPDLYLPFLKLATTLVKSGGFMLYVLPHAFLVADNARTMREAIAKEFWIRHLVDLSDLLVFEAVSSYPILLIAQRRTPNIEAPNAVITRCSGFAGHALQVALDGRTESTPFYSVYQVPQQTFEGATWQVLSPKDYVIQSALDKFPALSDFLEIAQGVNSGSDRAFIRDDADIPEDERDVYAPLLRDREMLRYVAPHKVASWMFYPFAGEQLLEEDALRARYPKTWAHLEGFYEELSRRSSVQRGQMPWWRPERPRSPGTILRPKIVGPHLMLVPRFSLDFGGRFLVSRSPYIYHSDDDVEALKIVLSILNSSIGHWQIINQSHRYSRGYARLEAATLRKFKLPNPASIPARETMAILRSVNLLLSGSVDNDIRSGLDSTIAQLYGIDLDTVSEVVVTR